MNTSENSLQALGMEYLAQAKLLQKQIDARRVQLQTGTMGYKDIINLEREISLLTMQQCDAQGIGNTLVHYYDRESKGESRRRNIWRF